MRLFRVYFLEMLLERQQLEKRSKMRFMETAFQKGAGTTKLSSE